MHEEKGWDFLSPSTFLHLSFALCGAAGASRHLPTGQPHSLICNQSVLFKTKPNLVPDALVILESPQPLPLLLLSLVSVTSPQCCHQPPSLFFSPPFFSGEILWFLPYFKPKMKWKHFKWMMSIYWSEFTCVFILLASSMNRRHDFTH